MKVLWRETSKNTGMSLFDSKYANASVRTALERIRERGRDRELRVQHGGKEGWDLTRKDEN